MVDFLAKYLTVSNVLNLAVVNTKSLKQTAMKLSKILLNAILISVTAGTLTSCEKDKDEQAEKNKEKTEKKIPAGNCPRDQGG